MNQMPKRTRRRRLIYFFFAIAWSLYMIYKIYPDSFETFRPFLNFNQPVLRFNDLIDQAGDYLPFYGYIIAQLVSPTESFEMDSLKEFLNENTDLQAYFKLTPYYTHHITLTKMKNQTKFNEDQLSMLIKEQNVLDQDDTSITATVNKEMYIEQNEIRLPVEINHPQYLNTLRIYQKRWDQNFGDLIVEQYSNFYITLAHQYKSFPSKTVENQMKSILKQWDTYPFEIVLDPIEFFSHNDIISYSALLPDIDIDSYELFYSSI